MESFSASCYRIINRSSSFTNSHPRAIMFYIIIGFNPLRITPELLRAAFTPDLITDLFTLSKPNIFYKRKNIFPKFYLLSIISTNSTCSIFFIKWSFKYSYNNKKLEIPKQTSDKTIEISNGSLKKKNEKTN